MLPARFINYSVYGANTSAARDVLQRSPVVVEFVTKEHAEDMKEVLAALVSLYELYWTCGSLLLSVAGPQGSWPHCLYCLTAVLAPYLWRFRRLSVGSDSLLVSAIQVLRYSFLLGPGVCVPGVTAFFVGTFLDFAITTLLTQFRFGLLPLPKISMEARDDQCYTILPLRTVHNASCGSVWVNLIRLMFARSEALLPRFVFPLAYFDLHRLMKSSNHWNCLTRAFSFSLTC